MARAMSDMKIAPVKIRWHAGLPIYASEEFLKTESKEFGWIAGFDAGEALRCILPYTLLRKLGLRMIRFQTETLSLDGELSLGEEKSFLNNVVEYFRSAKVDVIIPSGNHAIFRTYPDLAVVGPYGTIVNNLNQSEEVLHSKIRKTFRQNIRKAAAAGVQIRCGFEYLGASYQLIAETLQRSGVKFKNYREFMNRMAALGDSLKVFVAEHDGVIQGCMVAPFSKHAAYNCYAGSRPQPILGAMHLLHWEAMRVFRSMGVKRFDFQGVRINPEKGSKQEGIMHYKQGFGGELVQGCLWKCSLRPLKSIAYSAGVRLLMGGDIVDQEKFKLKAAKATDGNGASSDHGSPEHSPL